MRQGLKKAKTVLLEPYYSFRLELPAENVGRAMTDIQRMQGNFQGPETEGELAVITGSAPVAKMRDYQSQVISYTRGKGHLTCTLKGYEPCQDQEQIVQEIGYDSERDLENPTGSVFCAHGAGFVVPWTVQRSRTGTMRMMIPVTAVRELRKLPEEDIPCREKIHTVPVMGQEKPPVGNILRCMEATKRRKS